ncbi:feruloyl esterase B precursor protein [Colletotrichum truncatum]|uniref:Feruloyl esterase B protein n=1 Tax=Colletotrichum truncatum TaxID=5467 RepID=A0ACC3YRS5_COLTU|nr:feruloyl esterase B precursor protein [Colletotrichum truncatum]KAF6799304.1 feruloyl esterase B precursor protein [Colletotrichum truncatum]
MLSLLALMLSQQARAACTKPNITDACSPGRFHFPDIDGTAPISITAAAISNYTDISTAPGTVDAASYTISFCNVSVTYTHPGTDDAVNVQVWLPSPISWNGRLQAVGGGGYSASVGSLYMTQAVGNGYVALDTDAGHVRGPEGMTTPEAWALKSPGKVDMQLINNWGSTSLHEMAVIGKAVSKSYYGANPKYSYFTGCSGGGRQAMMIAQKYADDFDGIMAAAPAINIEDFLAAAYWPTQVMFDVGVVPAPCEIEAFTKAAVNACDNLDGVNDGIISLPALCNFDPHDIVGKKFSCNGTMQQFTAAAATIVQAAWTGPRSADGKTGWFGVNKDASLTGTLLSTECTSNASCTAPNANLMSNWIQYLLVKSPGWDASTMSSEKLFQYLQQSKHEYSSLLSAANPDLSAFREAGGKLITWHGLADEIIPPNGTIAYMERVLKTHADSDKFIRFYEAPGVGHCQSGAGAAPSAAFEQLVSWVENGTVPITLYATDATGRHRELCTFPLQQVYVGGDLSDTTSFGCKMRHEIGSPASDELFF